MGLSHLCNVMLLKNSNLEAFLSRFSPANCVLIRSLTIAIETESPAKDTVGWYVEDEEDMKRNGSSETKVLWSRLQDLATMISKMSLLSVFSFVLTGDYPARLGFWIPRPIIASMIENLSKSCLNIEIDTKGEDRLGTGSLHLCDKIRDVLPRLQHFRVRLGTCCPAMFCASLSIIDTTEDRSAASSLKTVIVNCATRYPGCGGSARLCGFSEDDPEYHSCRRGAAPEARVSLGTTLQDLFARGKYPKIERLWLVDFQDHAGDDLNAYTAFNRRDVILNKTWAIPFRNILAHDRDSILTRTPEMGEVFTFTWGVEQIAEAQTWKETFSGCRFPAATIATGFLQREDCRAKPLPIESVEAFKIRRPKKSCLLWLNEWKTGRRLLDFVEREGLVDTSPVREITPSGWIRDGGDLEPEES